MPAALRPLAAVVLATTGLAACDADKPAVEDDRMESYCEALCTWAADCAAEGWAAEVEDTSRDDLFADCLADTRAVSAPCADAEDGTLNAAQQTTLEDCTDAVAASAEDCAAVAGWESELVAAAPPEECGSQSNADATFRTAQDAVAEPGAQLCARQVAALCSAVEACGDSEDGSLLEACTAAFAAELASCVDTGRLDHGLDFSPEREAAQQCTAELAAPTCEELLAGELSVSCETGLGASASGTLSALLAASAG
jgi:hypothetical protein